MSLPLCESNTIRSVAAAFGGGGGGGFGGGGSAAGTAASAAGRWATDFPDSDLNFSFRLQQLTSLKVNPDPITMRLTDERLFDYPFIYIIEPGACLSRRRKAPRCATICSMAAS